MRDLMPASRFAQLARLSRKALRLYAEQGLLRPAHVNPDTGYRYYSLSQLEEARRIASLRDLGMPLGTIQAALRAWDTPGLSAHLAGHRDTLLRQAEQVQTALAALDILLARPPQPYAVHTKTVTPQAYLGLRAWCDPDQSCGTISAVQTRLTSVMDEALLSPAGAALARYHDEREDAWDVEVCLPFVGDPPPRLPAGVTVGELPGGTVAYTVHHGDCGGSQGMQGAYAAVWQWLHAHGHETQGGPSEIYLFDERNTENIEDHRTEVAWLLRP